LEARAQDRVEKALGLKCFDYVEAADHNSFSEPDVIAANVDNCRFSPRAGALIRPALTNSFYKEERGIAGDPSRQYMTVYLATRFRAWLSRRSGSSFVLCWNLQLVQRRGIAQRRVELRLAMCRPA
jgi:hypothetical protein